MQPPFDAIFDEAEHRYLKPDELQEMRQYVFSLKDRVSTYQMIRDRELSLMQQVADQIQYTMPDAELAALERSLKNAMLSLRYCSMGMVLNDPSFVQNRLLGWLSDSMQIHNSSAIDRAVFRLIVQQLAQVLTSQQMELFQPFLNLAQAVLPAPVEEEMLTVAGMF
ncbi:hypothetical protein [Myxacorys almedinensis]|uniref:Phycobilisome protein n=1 Tax=Myxacorys almedinensis A TaxID=2690445 RepID=A0A8J7Z4W8_9CYAN|nr:hypothetical protein [Myxacorys almedinensis]NDJ19869.1 hypothetical protein [Myxacorys almedinensis A]